MSIEILTDKLTAGEITRDEFLKAVKELTNKPKVDDHDDAYAYVTESLNVHTTPDPRVMVDLLALLLEKIEAQTGYVPNATSFEKFRLITLEDVLQVVSALKQQGVLFPIHKRSKIKFTVGEETNLGANDFIVKYLLNLPEVNTPSLSPEDF